MSNFITLFIVPIKFFRLKNILKLININDKNQVLKLKKSFKFLKKSSKPGFLKPL